VDYSELPEKSGLYCVLYTGKHKPEFIEPGTGAFLRNRNYLKFGEGKKYPHWGGRYIWQIKNNKNNNDLVLCWKLLTNKNSRESEKELMAKFEEKYNGRRPFANHQR